MSTNFYFNNFTNSQEQILIEDLVLESIQIYGHDVFYCPRTLIEKDEVYEEDSLSQYNSNYLIDMYIRSYESYEGDGQFLSKFGLEIRDQVTFTVAIRTFERHVTRVNQNKIRPRENDIIWLPLNQKMYRITYVEHESVFYQSGSLQVYDIKCELMEYSNERFDTGRYDIDHYFDNVSTTSTFVSTLENLANTDPIAQNFEFEKLADDILDFSDVDPFSENISIQDS